MARKAVTRAMWSQTKEHPQPPETGRNEEWILSWSPPKEHSPADTSISNSWTAELRQISVKPPNVWLFVTAAAGNRCKDGAAFASLAV